MVWPGAVYHPPGIAVKEGYFLRRCFGKYNYVTGSHRAFTNSAEDSGWHRFASAESCKSLARIYIYTADDCNDSDVSRIESVLAEEIFNREPIRNGIEIQITKGLHMREIDVSEITNAIRELCIEANHTLTPDMKEALDRAAVTEESPLGKQILEQLEENLVIAKEDMIPICQDTGMAVVYLEVGQDVHFTGGLLEDAVNEGVRQGYVDGFLRKSVVSDPIERVNTGDNTPAVLHYFPAAGDRVKITVAPKGFGSENMSRVFMLKPADGIEGVKNAVLSAVRDAGPNACPPMVVGVGIGGTFEKCALLSKMALLRKAGEHSEIPYVAEMEKELLERINQTGIGPGGLGGVTTALAVNVLTYPTHIAGLPVAVNICCHVNRHAVREL